MEKYLFISTHYSPNVIGGAELSVQTLAEELLKRGKSVAVISLSTTGTDSVDIVNGIRVYRLRVANIYQPFNEKESPIRRAVWHAIDAYNPRMAGKIAAILDSERPHVVSTHTLAGFSVAIWSVIRARGATLIHMLHDYYLLCPRSTMIDEGKSCEAICATCKVYDLSKRVASRQPDVVIGVSQFVLDRHLREGYFPTSASGVCFNGRTLPAKSERPRSRSPVLRLGFIGRIEPAKGIETLLKAVARLPPAKWTLSIAGRAVQPAYLAELRRKYPLKQVEYLGYMDATEFYRIVDMVVVPSEWHEPLPAVVYEPFGFGLPVLASRVGGIPEILGNARCGWLFEAGNVEELTTRLLGFLDGIPDEENLRSRAYERRRAFVPERQADTYLGLVERRSDRGPLPIVP